MKLLTRCRSALGVECVAKRHEISNLALQGLYSELDRERLARDDSLRGVSFHAADATDWRPFHFSHVYLFDRVFSSCTLAAMARVLSRSDFHVMVSSRQPREWWAHGLTTVQPVAKMRFRTTGKEGCTCYIYVNAQRIPAAHG